jgi:N12 class adenine-specific DNA methylase
MKDNKMIQSNNAFVKAEQQKMKKYMGNKPVMKREMEEFDAYMSNDGEAAQNLARKLTTTMDDAFPVK